MFETVPTEIQDRDYIQVQIRDDVAWQNGMKAGYLPYCAAGCILTMVKESQFNDFEEK